MTSLPLQTNKPILIKSNRDRLCEIFHKQTEDNCIIYCHFIITLSPQFDLDLSNQFKSEINVIPDVRLVP